MARAYSRGNPMIFSDKEWTYLDGQKITEERPCVRCGKMPTPEGYDACLGKIEGANAACCGHGVEEGYIILKKDS